MFRFSARRLLASRALLASKRFITFKMRWPEPITQQTIDQFLKEINYFEQPDQLVNIGLQRTSQLSQTTTDENKKTRPEDSSPSPSLDQVLELLGQEVELPALDIRDSRVRGQQLMSLAIEHGIYRDLFTHYTPDREEIKFTQEQAERLDKLVPNFWITDQPFARVDHKPKSQIILPYFEPLLMITANFIHNSADSNSSGDTSDLFAHTSYSGNIIPAAEAYAKPAIILNASDLCQNNKQQPTREPENWDAGTISCCNFSDDFGKYLTVALLNLDHLHSDAANLHWMAANIKPSNQDEKLAYEEVCQYLPVHGIQGFGYSRYVFLVFQHDSKLNVPQIEGFSLENRKFHASSFLDEFKSNNILPVGLSWFQTTWDISSNNVFHNYLNRKSPVYEYIEPERREPHNVMYPGKVPFNIYLDKFRSKKSINEQVLLERLKSVDPFDYKDQYVPPRVPPTVFVDENVPDWLRIANFKKKNKLGYWRGLRPASAILPLDNNADLDYPIRPIATSRISPPECPNTYEVFKKNRPSTREFPSRIPVNEFKSHFVEKDVSDLQQLNLTEEVQRSDSN